MHDREQELVGLLSEQCENLEDVHGLLETLSWPYSVHGFATPYFASLIVVQPASNAWVYTPGVLLVGAAAPSPTKEDAFAPSF